MRNNNAKRMYEFQSARSYQRQRCSLDPIIFWQDALMSFESAHFVQAPPEKLRGFFAAAGLDEVEQMDVFPTLRHKAAAIDIRFVPHEAPELALLAQSINEKDIPRALHDQFVSCRPRCRCIGMR